MRRLLLLALLLAPVAEAAFRRVPGSAPEAIADRVGVATLLSAERDGRVWLTTWRIDEALRGEAGTLQATWTEDSEPPAGTHLLLARTTPEGATVAALRTVDDARARKAIALPYGWTATPTGPIRPFGGVTSPPAATPGLQVTLERPLADHPDADEDAHVRITVSNPGAEPMVVEALQASDGVVRWRDSLVFAVGQHTQLLPACANVSRSNSAPLTLQPGASASVFLDLHELAFYGKHQKDDRTVTIGLGHHMLTTTIPGRKHASQHREAIERVQRGDCAP